jgi:hypothetical protein
MSDTSVSTALTLIHNTTDRSSHTIALQAALEYVIGGNPEDLERCLAADARLSAKPALTKVDGAGQ